MGMLLDPAMWMSLVGLVISLIVFSLSIFNYKLEKPIIQK